MKAISQMTQGELAAYIDTHLKKRGIWVVLSGGACVAIYSDYKYVSKDLDFIAQYTIDHKEISAAMREIDFLKDGKYYIHSDSQYFVEFISGPLTVGEDPISEIQELKFSTGNLRIISPTESVKDRLAAYYHWQDLQGLEQAILVASRQTIDIKNIEDWSNKEGKHKEFLEFRKRLN
jgi:hypothetical protein